MNDSDYIAQLFTLLCVVPSFIVLCSQEKMPFPFFSIFSAMLIPSSFIWLFSLWPIWSWFFPLLMISMAAASGESAWNMVNKLTPRERLYSHLFSVLSGLGLAELTWLARPAFPQFPNLSLTVGMMAAAFSIGCTISAGLYWWANRSAGVRPVVRHGAILGVYGAVVIASAIVSGIDPLGPIWHYSVQSSCYVRGILQLAATMTLVRSRRFFSIHA